MTPQQYIEFCEATREEFFRKFPKPSKTGPRSFWKQTLQHAHNAIEDNDWQDDTFKKAAKRILALLG